MKKVAYRFWTTLGLVNDDSIYILVQTVPLFYIKDVRYYTTHSLYIKKDKSERERKLDVAQL